MCREELQKTVQTHQNSHVFGSSLAGLGTLTGCAGDCNHACVWGDFLVRWQWSSGRGHWVLRPLPPHAPWLGRHLGLIRFPEPSHYSCCSLLQALKSQQGLGRVWRVRGGVNRATARELGRSWGVTAPLDQTARCSRRHLPCLDGASAQAKRRLWRFNGSVQRQRGRAEPILRPAASHGLQLWSEEPPLGFRGCSPWSRWPLAWGLRLLTGHPRLIHGAPPVAWIPTGTVFSLPFLHWLHTKDRRFVHISKWIYLLLLLQFSDNGLDFLALKWDNKMFSDLSA